MFPPAGVSFSAMAMIANRDWRHSDKLCAMPPVLHWSFSSSLAHQVYNRPAAICEIGPMDPTNRRKSRIFISIRTKIPQYKTDYAFLSEYRRILIQAEWMFRATGQKKAPPAGREDGDVQGGLATVVTAQHRRHGFVIRKIDDNPASITQPAKCDILGCYRFASSRHSSTG